MHFRRTSSNCDRRMGNHRTSLNCDRRMRNPPHVCTSVRSLQPMYVRPSLQHMYVHRFASRIHLRNTGLACGQRMRTPVPTQQVHSFAAHCLRFRLFTAAHAARPSLQYICVHLFAARMHSHRRVWFASDACAKPSLSKSPVKQRT